MTDGPRKAISPRIRFEVLKRAGFKCEYCGTPAGDSILHVDHIQARSTGGEDSPDNYAAACPTCNFGKGVLDVVPDAAACEGPVIRCPLVGRFFYTFNEYGNVQFHGHVIAKVKDDLFLVGLFSAFDGYETEQRMFPLSEMVNWVFFDKVEHAGHWFEYGDGSRLRGPKVVTCDD